MTNALTTHASEPDAAAIEQVLIGGDLARLTPSQRVSYYNAVCKSLGLNPLTKPFDYISLNGKLVLYAKRDCTDQLRKIHQVSITKLERDLVEGVYSVIAYAVDGTGRTDTSIGAVALDGLKGEARANATMKAETKAKRRVTLSICGLGMTDETETDSIPSAKVIRIDHQTGEILDAAPKPSVVDGPAFERPVPDEPEPVGFADWADNMSAAADEGTKAMVSAWNESPQPLRDYAVKYRRSLTEGWKAKAKAADKAVPRGA